MTDTKHQPFWELKATHHTEELLGDATLLLEAASQYFAYCASNPLLCVGQEKGTKVQVFTLSGLCLYIGCTAERLEHYKAGLMRHEKELALGEAAVLAAIARIEQTIYHQKYIYAAAGLLHPGFITSDLAGKNKTESKDTTIYVTVEDDDL